MEIYENILGNLTPSELDELAPAGFDAKAPSGALKRIGKAAVEKTGISAKRRKARLKPLIIAAAAVVASAATLFTVNAATDGNLVRFFIGGEEVEGSRQDYVDHDGYRHVSFDAIIPIEAENYAVIFDIDAPNYEEAVRVLTDESDPEIFESIRQYGAAHEQTEREIKALKEAGADETELPEFRDLTEFGIVFKDNELCFWNMGDISEGGSGGAYGGRFMTTGIAAGHPSNIGGSEIIDRKNGTKSFRVEFEYYVGLD